MNNENEYNYLNEYIIKQVSYQKDKNYYYMWFRVFLYHHS